MIHDYMFYYNTLYATIMIPRVVNVLPNRVLGIVGEHTQEFPVEALSLTSDGTCVVSCSHDQRIKFWNVEEFKHQEIDTSKKGTKKAKKDFHSKFGKNKKKNDFFDGLVADKKVDDEDGEDVDEDDDSDDSD